jgi:hypothetical protein
VEDLSEVFGRAVSDLFDLETAGESVGEDLVAGLCFFQGGEEGLFGAGD